jgi:hypothetical protein
MESEGGRKAYVVEGLVRPGGHGKMSELCSGREGGTGSQGRAAEVGKFEGS